MGGKKSCINFIKNDSYPYQMQSFTNLRRTKQYLRELKEWTSNEIESFPTHKKGDILLILNSKRIYEPYVAQDYVEKGAIIGGAVSKRPAPNQWGISPVRVIGTDTINYYDPEMEMDLNISPDNKQSELHVDGYEWRNLSGRMPSYVWLPHAERVNSFREILPHFLNGKTAKLEQILDDYYSSL